MGLKDAFSNGKSHVNVSTVGRMIEELQRLPADLSVEQGYNDDGTDIVIFNIESDNPLVQFAEGFEWADPFEDENGD